MDMAGEGTLLPFATFWALVCCSELKQPELLCDTSTGTSLPWEPGLDGASPAPADFILEEQNTAGGQEQQHILVAVFLPADEAWFKVRTFI